MRYAGIDIASQTHVVAVVDEAEEVLVKPTEFTEDVAGYEKLFELLGRPDEVLVGMESTGHYWRNLAAALFARGFAIALINPLRTSRFAGEDLQRTKTDAIDALGIARFARQKHPPATRVPDVAAEELRELVRLRDRLVQDFGDAVRQLHRLVDLGFPEFTKLVPNLTAQYAIAILREYPTARAFQTASVKRLAKIGYGERGHRVGRELAQALVAAAKCSVGSHHADVYCKQVRFACEDIDLLRRRIREIDAEIEQKLDDHEVGKLLTTIEGVGATTAARLVGELGDISRFHSAKALASYIGVAPALRQSGFNRSQRASISGVGNVQLRTALWMPVLVGVRKNPWLRAYYQRLRAEGKQVKVALIAAMRKLLIAVYWVGTNKKPFVPILDPKPAEVLA